MSSISSRTPEGFPNRCPVCGKVVSIDPSASTGDAPCPNCGHLLWWLQRRFPDHAIGLETAFIEDLGLDSLDMVKLLMELEEEFDVPMPNAAVQIRTVEDAMRYFLEHGWPPKRENEDDP